MKNYFLFKRFFCFFAACTLFAACIKKDAFDFSNSSVGLDGIWGTVLVNDEVAFTDFTVDSAVNMVSDNNVITLIYHAPLQTSGKEKDLFSSVDYQWHFSLDNVMEPSTPPSFEVEVFSGNQDILFYGDTAQVLIDTAVFNAGSFRMVVNSTLNHTLKFKIKSIYFHYPDGRILDTVITIPHNQSNFEFAIDLMNCRAKLQRNSLPCEVSISVHNDGQPFVGGAKSLSVDVFGTFYVFKFLRGQVISLTERISYESDFNLNASGKTSFLVQNVRGGKIRINSANSFGAGMVFTVDTCELVTNGTTTHLLSSASSTFQFDPAPTHFASKNQSFTIDLTDFSLAEKNRFRFGGSVLVNEPGMAGTSIWAFDTSSFSIEPSLELPLDFNLNYFVYRDTIAMDLSGIENADFKENLTFRVEMLNDFPLELQTQVYFLDGNYRIIDSLFSQPTLIEAASTNSIDGKTILAGKMNPSPQFMEINNTRLEKLNNARYIYINARATSNNQQVIVRSDQRLKIKIGVKAAVKTTFNFKSDK